MTMRRLISFSWLFFLAAMVCGCGGRSVTGIFNNTSDGGSSRPDAAVWPDGYVPPDGQVRPDAGPVCVENDKWTLSNAPIVQVELMNPMSGNGGISEGVSVRIRATVEVGGCDQMAGVQFNFDMQSRRVMLFGYIWQYHGNRACPEFLAQVPEYLSLRELSTGRWEVVDGLTSSIPPLLNFNVDPCGPGNDCWCYLWDGIPGGPGDQCSYNCMCEWNLDCNYEMQAGSGACYQTCSVDGDCPAGFSCLLNVLDMPQGICDNWGADECGAGTPCPHGFDCEYIQDEGVNWCMPAMNPDQIGTQCQDDCDCPAGFSCARREPNGPLSCQIMCRGNLDCPEVLCCDMGFWDMGANQLACDWCWDYEL